MSVSFLNQLDSPSSSTVVAVGVALVVLAVTTMILYLQTSFRRNRRHPVALTQEFQAFPLIQKKILTHDTRRFTFGLPPNHTLGLPVGQHMTLMFCDSSGKRHQRSYTPVEHDIGSVSFCIKVYGPKPPKFPMGGIVSQHLDSLQIGDSMEMKGPKGHLHWLGRGKFTVKEMKKPLQTRRCDRLAMIAGGTGITPMLQILHAIFRDNDSPNVKSVQLLYANQTEDDILVREELEELARDFADRFQLHYTVDQAPPNWKYSTGFITKNMIAEHLYDKASPVSLTQVFMCGPPPMIKFACLPNLEELGFTDQDWVVL